MNSEQTSFLMPLGADLDPCNRWVQLSRIIPWDEAERIYSAHFTDRQGGPRPLSARVALGSLVIKERLGLTDEETIEQIRENPYLQYFLGFASYRTTVPFDSSLLVHFRKRFGQEGMQRINQVVIERELARRAGSSADSQAVEPDEGDDGGQPPGQSSGPLVDDSPSLDGSSPAADSMPQGALLIDATCAPADITYPTDVKLLNHAREVQETVIDRLHTPHRGQQAKPRTYRRKARKAFLSLAKAKRLSKAKLRTGIGKQLRFIRRNQATIARFIEEDPECLERLEATLYRKLLVVAEAYRQQDHLYQTGERSVSDRIVNIAQPHVRPIVRGKAGAPCEFGAKISVSLTGGGGDGLIALDRLSWDAYHEGADLVAQAEAFRQRTGCYPAAVYADKAYRTKANRAWCKERGIRLAGIGPGRPPKDPAVLRDRLREARGDEAARQPIEGVFGRAKRRFGLKRIMSKLATTSAATIALTFLVMNVEQILLLLCVLMVLTAITALFTCLLGPAGRRLQHAGVAMWGRCLRV